MLREAQRVKRAQDLPIRLNHYELAKEQNLIALKHLQMSLVVADYRTSNEEENEQENEQPLPPIPLLKTPDAKQPGVPMETQPKMTHCHHVPNRVSLLSQH